MVRISDASQSQSTTLGEITDAVTQLDRVTQQNAALVERTSSSAENLRSRADDLLGAVGVFKIDDMVSAKAS